MPLFLVQRDLIAHLVALLLPVGIVGAVIALGCLCLAFLAFRRGNPEKGGIGLAGWLMASVLSLAAGFGQNWAPTIVCVGVGLLWAIATAATDGALRVQAWSARRAHSREARELASPRGEVVAAAPARVAPRRAKLETATISVA